MVAYLVNDVIMSKVKRVTYLRKTETDFTYAGSARCFYVLKRLWKLLGEASSCWCRMTDSRLVVLHEHCGQTVFREVA